MPDGPAIYTVDVPDPPADDSEPPDLFGDLTDAAGQALSGNFAAAADTLKKSKFWLSGVFWLAVLIILIGGYLILRKDRK